MAKRKSGRRKPDAFPYFPLTDESGRYPSSEWVDPDEMLLFFNELVERMPADERESRRVAIDAIRRAISQQRFILRDTIVPSLVREAPGPPRFAQT